MAKTEDYKGWVEELTPEAEQIMEVRERQLRLERVSVYQGLVDDFGRGTVELFHYGHVSQYKNSRRNNRLKGIVN